MASSNANTTHISWSTTQHVGRYESISVFLGFPLSQMSEKTIAPSALFSLKSASKPAKAESPHRATGLSEHAVDRFQ